MLLRIKLLIWIKLYAFKYNIIKKRSMWKNHRHSSGTVHRFYYVLNPGQISVYLRNSNQFAHFNMGHVIRLIFFRKSKLSQLSAILFRWYLGWFPKHTLFRFQR